jgi:hypothetical protein
MPISLVSFIQNLDFLDLIIILRNINNATFVLGSCPYSCTFLISDLTRDLLR